MGGGGVTAGGGWGGEGGGGRGRGLRKKQQHTHTRTHCKNRRCNIWRQYCCNMRNCTTKKKSQTRKHKNQDHTEKSGLKRKPNYHRQMEPPPTPLPDTIDKSKRRREEEGGRVERSSKTQLCQTYPLKGN